MKIRLAGEMTTDSIVDGEGIRSVIWTQGCIHNCPGCHNPETHSFEKGVLREISDVCDEISKLEFQDGITLSGGDPMYEGNRHVVLDICQKVKAMYPTKDIWMWTGYTYEEIHQDSLMTTILSYVDVLVDGRYMKELRDISIPWRGSTNQRVIDVKKSSVDNIVKHCE